MIFFSLIFGCQTNRIKTGEKLTDFELIDVNPNSDSYNSAIRFSDFETQRTHEIDISHGLHWARRRAALNQINLRFLSMSKRTSFVPFSRKSENKKRSPGGPFFQR